MPVKERKLKILLLLFLVKDTTFDYVELTPELLSAFDLTLNQKTKGTLSSMLKEGFVEKNDGLYKLTDKGFYELSLSFPFFRFIRDDWDGVWRIISYEIPESKRHLRDSLRREMRGWGLGPWHRSFWVTTHPIIPALRDLVYGREEEQYIQSFESTHMFGDVDVLVEKVWEKSVLEKRYKELFRVWHGILSKNITKDEKYKQVLNEYIKYVKDDPGLPINLVGRQWIGREAFDIYKEMRGILLTPPQTNQPAQQQ